MSTVEVDVVDDVHVIRLNRPEKLNAWTPTLGRELVEAVTNADGDESCRAIVVTGNGRGFSAGADFGEYFSASDEQVADDGGFGARWIGIVRGSKPIVAAVNGVAVGVGVTMVLPFDSLIASEAARFSFRFTQIGLVPELASTFYLPSRVGLPCATELMLSGRFVDGTEAAALGLVDGVVAPGALVDAAIERARLLSTGPADALRWTKQLLTANAAESDLDVVQAREAALIARARQSDAHRLAVEAFTNRT